jgi:hypothetical protein
MKNLKYIFLIIIGVGSVSCQKEFLNRVPLNSPSDATFWQTEEQVKAAANACYSPPFVKDKNTVDREIIGDNTLWPSGNNYQTIGSGNYNTDISNVNNEWNDDYAGIARCNNFLENYTKANFDEAKKERYAAEVRFIRAYLYFYLTETFGDVPLITKTLDINDPEVFGTREKKDVVVDFILKELDEIAPKLPLTYPAAEYGRITRGATIAFKSRVALFFNRYAVAETAAKAVMDLGIYQLYNNGNPKTSYKELFTLKADVLNNANNKETIMAFVFAPDIRMHNFSRELHVPDQAIRWNPTKSLVDSYLCSDGLPIDKSPLYEENSYEDYFKNRDPRMTQTILQPGEVWGGRKDGNPANTNLNIFTAPKFNADKRGAVTITGFYFIKYVELTAVPTFNKDHNDIIILRLAEVILNWAEAKLEQGTLTQADLDMSINKLRDRVGMKHMNLIELASNGMNLRDEVRRERRIELALEGLRYYDILRWRQGSLLAQDSKGMKRSFALVQNDVKSIPIDAEGNIVVYTGNQFVEPKHYLWPVPFAQLQRNPNLGQNPGWE